MIAHRMSAIERKYRILVLASAVAILLPTLLLPLSWDNEIYQSMATDFLRYGRLPYIGSWDQNFPGIVFLHTFSILLFGNSAIGFHLFDFLVHIAFSYIFYVILRRWLSAGVSWIATTLYNLRYTAGAFWLVGQRDSFAAFFLLLSVLTLFQFQRKSFVHAQWKPLLFGFLAGILMGFAAIIRPTYLPLLFIGAGGLFFVPKQIRTGGLCSYVIGIILLCGSMILYFGLHSGGLHEFYLATVRYNLEIYGPIHLALPKVIESIWKQKFYFAFSVTGMIVAYVSRKHGKSRTGITRTVRLQDMLLIGGIGASGLCSLIVMGKYLMYHYELIMLIMIPFCTIGMEFIIGLLSSRVYKCVAIGVLGLYIIVRVAPVTNNYDPLIASLWDRNQGAFAAAQDSMVTEPDYRMSVDQAIANYIDSSAPPQASIASISLTAGIRWRSLRRSVDRYTTFYPLVIRTPQGVHPDFQQVWREAFIDSIRREKPYYILMGNGPKEILDWVYDTPRQAMDSFPGFDCLLDSEYRFDRSIGGYSIWKIKYDGNRK